jgi:DNA-directed RNA polymerase specialized sigma24 family protein
MGDESGGGDHLGAGRDDFMSHVEGVLDPAYRLATVMLMDHAVAEDVVHDATMRAWSRYRRMKGEVTSFRTWFLAIVVDRCRAAGGWRPWRRRPDQAGRVEVPDSLSGALAELPVASRTALFCFVSLELPMDEVARVLGTSLSRVRSRVYGASDRLQARLDPPELPGT